MGLENTAHQFLELLARAKHGFVEALPNMAAAVLVLLLGWGLAWTLRKVVRRLFRRVPVQMPPGAAETAACRPLPALAVICSGLLSFGIIAALRPGKDRVIRYITHTPPSNAKGLQVAAQS